MDTSFYTAARGAMTQQERMNVISNNIANVNTPGYKTKEAVFLELMHYNMRAPQGRNTHLTAGAGAAVNHTNTNFSGAGFQEGDGNYNFAISGDGFFMLRDPAGGVSYTRNGHFSLSRRQDGFYLVSDSGKLVTDSSGNPIRFANGKIQGTPGIYTFQNTDGMLSTGMNEFQQAAKNGAPILSTDARLQEGVLEMSNVELADEMAKTMESSRAYSLMLKMMETSDEVEQTVNSLRS
ncbi:flagellar hook-basal body protein [Muricomes intestini]|jgi:flagellar basal-body rod protein FlgG|uniref:flagellar hook-basal body protein n=1 Tax=Muricomes intestini TaxID=1796634 RepID=UPI000E91890D|nr:flagellar hook-basal body protein [Lachnospiraceae bacterium]HCR83299.1 flagellar hook-basal body protein [Lachnospiraceae bacterium]